MEAYTRVDTDVVTGLRQPLEASALGLRGGSWARTGPGTPLRCLQGFVPSFRARVRASFRCRRRSVDRFAAAVDRLTGLGWLDR